MLPFFYLPNIRSISLPIGTKDLVRWPTSPPTPSLLTSLRLSRLDHIPTLRRILSVTTSLESLRCNFYYQRTTLEAGNRTPPVLDLNLFNDALIPTLRTLVHLELTCTLSGLGRTMSRGPGPRYPLSVNGSLGRLEDFGELRTLVIPLVFLCGLEADTDSEPVLPTLPQKLEEVTITECLSKEGKERWTIYTAIPVLSKWSSLSKELTPQLRKLCLCFRTSSGAETELANVCAVERIQFDVCDEYLDRELPSMI